MKPKSNPKPRAEKPLRAVRAPPASAAAGRSFPVIAMAASEGGLKALSVILSGLPADFPAAIAIVMHLSPHHESILAEILDRRSPLVVKQAKTGDFLCPSCVFVAPPNHHLLVGKRGCLRLSSPSAQKVNYARPSAEPLFVSVAKVYQRNAIAVVLTGGDGDGSFGVQIIKDEGGMVIAQDRPTSQNFSMPETSIKTGDVDFILPLDEIAPMLMELVERGASQFLAGQGGVNSLPTRPRTRSPSPRPSPAKGEGGASMPVRESGRSGSSGRGLRGSLSQRERAGVREKSPARPAGLQETEMRPVGDGGAQKDGRRALKRRTLTHALTKLAMPRGSVGTTDAATKRRK